MKRTLAVIAALAACVTLFFACATPNPANAKENSSKIFIATAKGFNGEVRYMGDQDGFSYFLIGDYFKHYYKKPIAYTRLHERFPLGSGHPYRPTVDEVGS